MNKLVVAILISILFSSVSFAQEVLVIAGAGPSTEIVELFFQNFAKLPAAQNYQFIVPKESIKHAGGIKHTYSNLFGRTGRPLNDKEILYKREQIFLAMVPISFVTGREVHVDKLSMRELEMIFQKQITNWKKVGGPDAEITTVGREPTEALFSELKRDYTFFIRSVFDVVLQKDNEVIDFLNSPLGRYAIAFGAKPNLKQFNEILVKEDLRSGVRLGLVYDRKYVEHPLVLAVKEYAQSEAWKNLVRGSGAYPVK